MVLAIILLSCVILGLCVYLGLIDDDLYNDDNYYW